MKELHELLKYIDSYIYTRDEEKIRIEAGCDLEEATNAYNNALKALWIDEESSEDDEPIISFPFYGTDKWSFDIAIDCVRRMTEEDRKFVSEHMWSNQYHHGYAMGIRNEYIHCAEKHHSIEPDDTSTKVMQIIFSIVSPIYDCTEPECVDYFEDFDYSDIHEQYYERCPKVFAKIEKELLSPKSELSSEDAILKLREELAKAVTRDELFRLFEEFMEKYHKDGKWYEKDSIEKHFEAILFPLEENQLMCLEKVGYFYNLMTGKMDNIKQCEAFIEQHIGLKDDYKERNAFLTWEVCFKYMTDDVKARLILDPDWIEND